MSGINLENFQKRSVQRVDLEPVPAQLEVQQVNHVAAAFRQFYAGQIVL